MSTPFEIADRLTEEYSDLDPISATSIGVSGRDHLPTDYSPDGAEARTDLFRRARSELGEHLEHPDPIQSFAARVITGWLDTRLDEADSRKSTWDLNHIYSPFQEARDVFDVMARDDAESWDSITARLNSFPFMLEGYRESLTRGLESGEVAAIRQVMSVIEQVETEAGTESRFVGLEAEAAEAGFGSESLSRAVETARQACRDFAGWLKTSYLPAAPEADGVGGDRYLVGADSFLGMPLDLDETYQWGWSEVQRILGEMERTASEIDDTSSLAGVLDMLENDPARAAATRQEFIDFVQAIQDQAITQLDGTHFDVPEPIKTVTVNLAPPGGALGAWYIGPSEDFSRPGSIWYAPGERDSLPYWSEVTTAYHEGFPGHHLQVGIAQLEEERLSRFHRMYIWYSGAGEGWALYAERLMDELGYFEKPEYRLGLLASQLFRATRVVVDIGNHLSLTIPDDAPLHRGERWNFERAVDYMEQLAVIPRDVAESEVKRYLGWWGQAISYKVGEREILSIRDDAMKAAGAGFDQKDFHSRMLRAGAIRLDHLRSVMLS
jgi:uncharacterized protein (DUF885 family)